MNLDNIKNLSDEELLEKLLEVQEKLTNFDFDVKLLQIFPDAQDRLSELHPNLNLEELLGKERDELVEVLEVLKNEIRERIKRKEGGE